MICDTIQCHRPTDRPTDPQTYRQMVFVQSWLASWAKNDENALMGYDMTIAFWYLQLSLQVVWLLCMNMTAEWQQLDIMLNRLLHIYQYTHPPTMINTLLLLQSMFWFDCTQFITFNIMISNILLQFKEIMFSRSAVCCVRHFAGGHSHLQQCCAVLLSLREALYAAKH